MNFSERNKKVALARWKKKHSEERERIKDTAPSILLKASICGFLAGDGSVQKRKEKNYYHHQLDFFPDDELMLDSYMNAISEVYGKIPTIREHKNYFSARINSKVIVEDLLQLASFGTKNWTLPTKLFLVDGTRKEWLRAFFSAEAYVNNKSIKIQTINREGMLKIKAILTELGIITRYYEYEPKKENHSKVYILFINCKKDRKLFYEKIGFLHNKKTKILRESLGL